MVLQVVLPRAQELVLALHLLFLRLTQALPLRLLRQDLAIPQPQKAGRLVDRSEVSRGGHLADLKGLVFRLEDLKEGLPEGHLVDLKDLVFRLEGLKGDRLEGHLVDRLEGLLGLEPLQQVVRSEGL